MSMARPNTSSSYDSNDSHDSSAINVATPTATTETPPILSSATPTLSLADRTRQSISHFPLPSSALGPSASLTRKPTKSSSSSSPRKPPHARTQSSIVPQSTHFETPRKSRRSSFGATLEVENEGVLQESRRRDLTPTEKLFDAGVDYNSVFKSRPRVAVSPSPSPSPFAGKGRVGEEQGSPLGQ